MKIKRIVIVLMVLFLGSTSLSAQETGEFTILSAPEAKEFIERTSDLIIVDVRTPEEFKEGHISGAKNIDFYDKYFIKELEKLDKTKPILLYCRSGNRSGKAAKMMVQGMGFKNIYDIEGGYLNWNKVYPSK